MYRFSFCYILFYILHPFEKDVPTLLCRLCVEVVGLVDASQRRRLDFTSGQRLQMFVWWPWSADGMSVQLGLRVAGLCGVAARSRAVVYRDGGPGMWCWWFALSVAEQLDVGAAASKVSRCCGHRSRVVWATRSLWRSSRGGLTSSPSWSIPCLLLS
jgi:hypothetical protein